VPGNSWPTGKDGPLRGLPSWQPREEAATLEEVLKLENSRQHTIVRLVITSSASTQGEHRPEHEVQVDFDSKAVSRSSTGQTSKEPKILIIVRSDSPGWASRTLSDVEEQVERTRFEDIGQRGALVAIVVLLLLLLLALVGGPFLPSSPTSERTMWLREADIDRLEEMLSPGAVLTEEQVREITTMQLRNVLNDERPKVHLKVRSWKEISFVFIPLVAIVASAMYLLLVCYPKALFLWGDAAGRYETLKQTRTLLWSIIIGTVFVAVLTNVFKEGLTSWLSR